MSDGASSLIFFFISFVQHETNKQTKHKHFSLKENVWEGKCPDR